MTASVVSLMLLLGAAAAAANFFGGAIVVHRHWERRYLRYFVALSAGFMLAVVLAEMLPESLRLNAARAPLFILAGYLIVHFFEHTLAPHFHFREETHADEFVPAHIGYSVLVGLVILTFFDGIAIASGLIVSNWLGWVIFLTVIVHRMPERFTISSVMLACAR